MGAGETEEFRVLPATTTTTAVVAIKSATTTHPAPSHPTSEGMLAWLPSKESAGRTVAWGAAPAMFTVRWGAAPAMFGVSALVRKTADALG